MLQYIAISIVNAALAAAVPMPSPGWTATNDPAVTFRWNVEPASRSFCTIEVADSSAAQDKRVSIAYRNHGGAHIDLTLRMNSKDSHRRVLTSCTAVEQVAVIRSR